ncbi:UPBEAT1 [Hibiscus trionum]|uniref:UPBEAT1 n=1 Tax=Hibiscus trionum TaxID=183268 RepID=A0A9W7I034_HIBTR|nr:UPBEAT1 [Hibiscus trionum]
MSDSNGSSVKRRHSRCRRRSVLMKRRAGLEVSRRGSNSNPFERKVEMLKKLIPNKETVGLDGLFRETAEYIMCLQMRVKVMQIMVEVLTG